MTERLYYTDPFLYAFDARVLAVVDNGGRRAVLLDRSAFYPTSGGQIHDTGWLQTDGHRLPVVDVQENEATHDVLHVIDGDAAPLEPGSTIHGVIDAERRRDHMQQHSGQHIISAAFEKLYGFATVSFHMGDESCTIDLATDSLSGEQLRGAERLANEVIAEDRPVEIRFATPDEARASGVRKIPAAEREKLRLIDIRDFDLNACGGTHVHSTGQIGSILLRKMEKARQGVRVEFVCGLRAVGTARRDFETLTEAAAVFSTHIWEVPQQAAKALEEVKAAQKAQHRLLEDLAELEADRLVRTGEQRGGQKLVVRFFDHRDLAFIKMLAQKIAKLEPVVALFACGGASPSLVFAQSSGLGNDMGALMKKTVQALGTRGGGNRDNAQGGAPDAESAERAIVEAGKLIAESL